MSAGTTKVLQCFTQRTKKNSIDLWQPPRHYSPDAVNAVSTPLVGESRFCPGVIPQVHGVTRRREFGLRPVVIQRLEAARLAHPSRPRLRRLFPIDGTRQYE